MPTLFKNSKDRYVLKHATSHSNYLVKVHFFEKNKRQKILKSCKEPLELFHTFEMCKDLLQLFNDCSHSFKI